MSKYQPLGDHLGHLQAHEWRPTFHELERMLGADLPKAARSKTDWWTDSSKSHAVWETAGWSAEPQLDDETVIFRKKDNDMAENMEQGTQERGGISGRGRELLETGREVFTTGREQVLSAAERAAPAVKKYGPWAALGAAVVGVVSFITFRQLQKRGDL